MGLLDFFKTGWKKVYDKSTSNANQSEFKRLTELEQNLIKANSDEIKKKAELEEAKNNIAKKEAELKQAVLEKEKTEKLVRAEPDFKEQINYLASKNQKGGAKTKRTSSNKRTQKKKHTKK
jgi:hypothetical protein